jgi:hypothetical protein
MIPLQIFEKHPDADAYRVGGFYSPYALVATEKRFTDAELAAEYWAAALDADLMAPAYLVAITATVGMFATRPHAHETDYQ